MKGVLVIIDGLGDLPHYQLNDKTPLEVAETPNLDFFATRGELGLMHPVKPGFIPAADEALTSIFGNESFSNTRGVLEAKGSDLELTRGDLAFRVNFATIDSLNEGNIVDRSVGRTLTTKEVRLLVRDLNSRIKLSSPFVFEHTLHHRGVLIFRGGHSDNISCLSTSYVGGKIKRTLNVRRCFPLDDEENSEFSSKLVNEFVEKAHDILRDHPINLQRVKKGLMPANYILLSGAGTEVPKLKKYKKWMAVSNTPLEIGFARASEMRAFAIGYPPLRNLDAYENFHKGLKKTCKSAIKYIRKGMKKFDYAYLHFSETDFPSHDNKPLEKKAMIEHIDKTVIKYLRRIAPSKKISVVVTSNYSSPCKLKEHSADPVPVLIYNDSLPRERHFSEKEAKVGSFGRIVGKDLLKKVGFSK